MDEKEVITKHEHVYYNNKNECRDASIWVYFVISNVNKLKSNELQEFKIYFHLITTRQD